MPLLSKILVGVVFVCCVCVFFCVGWLGFIFDTVSVFPLFCAITADWRYCNGRVDQKKLKEVRVVPHFTALFTFAPPHAQIPI